MIKEGPGLDATASAEYLYRCVRVCLEDDLPEYCPGGEGEGWSWRGGMGEGMGEGNGQWGRYQGPREGVEPRKVLKYRTRGTAA